MARDTDAGRTVTRRSMVAAVAAGGATLLGAGGAAAAVTAEPTLDDLRARGCDCSYETRCLATFCSNGSPEEETRECCECDTGETACGSWTDSGCCDEVRV